MKYIIVFSTLFALAFGVQWCASDLFEVKLLGQLAFSPSSQGADDVIVDQNQTGWVDYKSKMVAASTISYVNNLPFKQFTIQNFNKMEMTTVNFLNKTCMEQKITDKMPDQCIPDNAQVIANFTSIGGKNMSVVRFSDSNARIATMVFETTSDGTSIPIVQTIAFKTPQGDGFNTQLFIGTSSKFDMKIFNIPDFCNN